MTRHTLHTRVFDNPFFDRLDRAFLPSTVGFDRAFEILDHAANTPSKSDTSFPPYSLIKLDEYKYQIELAIAGYKESELEVVAEKNKLTVVGVKSEKDERSYIVKGIAGRSFTREFVLADNVVVHQVVLENGILTILLENVVPEEEKPRKIEIGVPKAGQKAHAPKAELLIE